jgi:hypothetical protein
VPRFVVGSRCDLNFNAFAVDCRISAHAEMISAPAVLRAS